MRIFINALSTTNESGRQVLCGLLVELLRATHAAHTLTILLHRDNADIADYLRSHADPEHTARMTFCKASGVTRHWLGRSVYESVRLPRLLERSGADIYLSPSGGWVSGLSCPQYTLALNPWAMVATGSRGVAENIKAWLQRRGYRQAIKRIDGIGYGSMHMRDLYRANAGGKQEKRSAIVYPALPSDELSAMDVLWRKDLPRDTHQILCVSHMAPHKDIETLLQALKLLRETYQVPATLRLVGRWSHIQYKRKIDMFVRELALGQAVTMDGFLSRHDLLHAYRHAKVYCLLSRSESFGIPSVEAQRLGTPVVAAHGSAASEVCGDGGMYVDAGDAEGAATCLARLLTDDDYWQNMSVAARKNAQRFEYAKTVRPLLALLGIERT